MGTRGAYGFRVKGCDKVTYNHFDSYPSMLGQNALELIKNNSDDELKRMADDIVLVDETVKTTPQERKYVRKFADKHNITISDTTVGSKTLDDWYCLLRDIQGSFYVYSLGFKYMIDSRDFLFDSLFCEYAYIINTDSNKLEVYKGFNKDKDAPGRYSRPTGDGSEYYGIALVKEIPFEEARKLEKLTDLIED